MSTRSARPDVWLRTDSGSLCWGSVGGERPGQRPVATHHRAPIASVSPSSAHHPPIQWGYYGIWRHSPIITFTIRLNFNDTSDRFSSIIKCSALKHCRVWVSWSLLGRGTLEGPFHYQECISRTQKCSGGQTRNICLALKLFWPDVDLF